MEFSLENMCRACMNEEGSMFSVYGKDESLEININYSEMIMNFTSVQIKNEDGLPKQICQYCLKQLILAYTFKETIESSDATLREITKNPGIEFIKQEILDNEYYDENEDQDAEQTIKSEGSDFKLTAEFLDDDFHVAEDENDFTSDQIEIDESDNKLDDDELETLKSVDKNFIPSIEQLKQSVMKPKSPRKINRDDCDEYLPVRAPKLQKHAKQYVCPLCSKRFAKYETFRKHKTIHKTLKCELCEKEFRSTHGLRYHMKIHSGVKNYACTFENCEKKFRLKQALDKHLSIHNNEKNHLCPICGKTYAQYDALHYHIRNHTGERPYLCVHCGKTFKQSCHLKNHMWNHTGIKPHKCKSCGKCYTTGHQLKKHLRKFCNNPANQKILIANNDNVIRFEIKEVRPAITNLEMTEDQEETENATKTIYLQ